jgi:hypothetical protein
MFNHLDDGLTALNRRSALAGNDVPDVRGNGGLAGQVTADEDDACVRIGGPKP